MAVTLEKTAWRLFSKQFKEYQAYCTSLSFSAGSLIVDEGKFNSPDGKRLYAAVPLAYIASGTVAIIENDKAVKYYGKGECLGLFETACFLDAHITKPIGRWSVVAVGDVQLMLSSSTFLKHTTLAAKHALIRAARANPIAKPLTTLPLLDWFMREYAIEPKKDVAILYHGHVLPSSQEFIKHLAYVAGPERTFVLEKPYSTIPGAYSKIAEGGVHTYQLKVDPHMSYDYSVKRSVDYVWQEVLERIRRQTVRRIIVISDGADILLSPAIRELGDIEIIGVEQTERGLRRLQNAQLSFPVISIAATVAKKHHESPFIAGAALAKLHAEHLIRPDLVYGVIGAGAIGGEIIRGLQVVNIRPIVYDPLSPRSRLGTYVHSMEKLVQKADIIIGTTGNDSLRGMYIERLHGTKTFVSISSSNVEFAYLFDLAKTYANNFEDISLAISPTFTAHILNGGYPINFDRAVERESQADIQLTRALLYAAVFQALSHPAQQNGVDNLSSDLEQVILNRWLKLRVNCTPPIVNGLSNNKGSSQK